MVLSDHVRDLLSHIALRLLKIIEPYSVEQERMANAQLLMYGSKHLEQNFFSFFYHLNLNEYKAPFFSKKKKFFTTTWDCWVPWGTQLFPWKIDTNFKIKSAAKPECHQNWIFISLLNVLLMWVAGVLSIHYWEISSRRIASHCIMGVFGSIVLGIIILLIGHSLKRHAVHHASSCISIMHCTVFCTKH